MIAHWYRWVWACGWVTAAFVPVFFGLLVASPVAMFCIAGVTTTCGAAFGRFSTADCLAAGLLAAAGVAGLWWFGPTTLAAMTLAVASSPYVLDRLIRLVRAEDASICVAHTVDGVGSRSTWSESYVALQRAQTPDECLAIVNARQAYLDELEIRNAAGFRSWLRSGAHPIGDPASFLRDR